VSRVEYVEQRLKNQDICSLARIKLAVVFIGIKAKLKLSKKL
jgi:hypothetical protein